ncbi:MAG: hypothetical protein HC825_03670 [Oscillatoriales cyanobacterium RM1_1_9]|nr:hypothetical protein [Oscillatoriales cyanobacterium SM2_3_0]NJO45735.1 hypothetical protein [Oscillatoriales cyanobacterium RM2_1_1]NJO71033.1 hypothetical protein [Oscillatoriales cyanobacterium RM1_1_9]
MASIAQRLEQYTENRPQEVLVVKVLIDQEPDEILVFRGFSSSLARPTAFDPEVPVLPDRAEILTIDRVRGPYTPDNPQYIQQGLSWEEFQLQVLNHVHFW